MLSLFAVMNIISALTTPLTPRAYVFPARSESTPTVDEPPASTRTHTPTVTYVQAGISGPAQGTLLETAEAMELAPAFGCRRGVCNRCATPMNSGHVRNDRTGEILHGATQVRVCVSSPLTDTEIDI